ncbi:MAG: hypothetical protein LUG93_07605 [Lachnospiraceae bacterium]|nr:hypothetical protein [Lachnospiraceae bacterium]
MKRRKMKNKENMSETEKKFKKVELVLNFLFCLLMVLLLDLFENLGLMNKVWMQLIFVFIYAIIWGKSSELILSVIWSRIENNTEN